MRDRNQVILCLYQCSRPCRSAWIDSMQGCEHPKKMQGLGIHPLWKNSVVRRPGARRVDSCRGGLMPVIELWDGRWRDRVVELTGTSCIVGSDEESVDIALSDDTVSGVHAILERVGTTWLVRDLGSRNGTRLDGERLAGQLRLRDGAEIMVGRSRLVFRDSSAARRPQTDALDSPPMLTRTENLVLIELCRPLVSHNTFQPPASVREIAGRLFIGKNAVQAHLTNLYDKFGIHGEDGVNRRVVLANEAIQRGAVTIADLADACKRSRRTCLTPSSSGRATRCCER